MKLLAQHLHRAELCLLRAELTGTSGSTFQMCTRSFASADAQGQTSVATPFSKHKNPLVLFSATLKPKMQTEEEARSMWRTRPYPSPLLQRRGELLPVPTTRGLRTSVRLGGCKALWKTMLPLSSFFSRSDVSGHGQ